MTVVAGRVAERVILQLRWVPTLKLVELNAEEGKMNVIEGQHAGIYSNKFPRSSYMQVV